jgi:hypothetical protein
MTGHYAGEPQTPSRLDKCEPADSRAELCRRQH